MRIYGLDFVRLLAPALIVGVLLGGCEADLAGSALPPIVDLRASSVLVKAGESVELTWTTRGVQFCTSSGSWSGVRPKHGSFRSPPLRARTSVFILRCTGPGGQELAAVAIEAAGGDEFGLDFPGVSASNDSVRFRFTRPLSIYPATYIWRVKLRSQPHYYTAFFWGNDGPFQWDVEGLPWSRRATSNTYYGAHPYPYPAPNYAPPGGVGPRYWEISVNGLDVLSKEEVEYGRWHVQALRVWANGAGKHHQFFWDLPIAGRLVERVENRRYGNKLPPSPALTWGDAPWAPGREVMKGVIRGIQIYTQALPFEDILREVDSPLSTARGRSSIWYLKLDPTPLDIEDGSGGGNSPEWVGTARPALWTGSASTRGPGVIGAPP